MCSLEAWTQGRPKLWDVGHPKLNFWGVRTPTTHSSCTTGDYFLITPIDSPTWTLLWYLRRPDVSAKSSTSSTGEWNKATASERKSPRNITLCGHVTLTLGLHSNFSKRLCMLCIATRENCVTLTSMTVSVVNHFNASCSKWLLFKRFSAILV